MELASICDVVVEDGVWFTPAMPDGEKCDFEFLVIGRNTEEYRRAIHKNVLKLSSNKKKDQSEAIGSADIFIACVKNWRGITDNGKEHPCTRENKEAMYKNPKLRWLTEQVENFSLNDENFLSVKE